MSAVKPRIEDFLPSEFPVEGEPTGVNWYGPNGSYYAVCPPCQYISKPLAHSQARSACRTHIETDKHRRHRSDIPPPRKRLTTAQWGELDDDQTRQVMRDIRRYNRKRFERLDREAIVAGYPADYGHGRPWYRKHLRELAERSGEAEILAALDRLDEIAEAVKEQQTLQEIVREWQTVAELADRQHGGRRNAS